MKFLCLAYGDEDGWNSLSAAEKDEALANDAAISLRGSLMAPVKTEVKTVSNWGRKLEVVDRSYSGEDKLPLAGFSVIEAETVEAVIELVAETPCARANGYIEIRAFWAD